MTVHPTNSAKKIPTTRTAPENAVLVVGATGFIGAHIVAALFRTGRKVHTLTRCASHASRRFPGARAASLDLASDAATATTTWLSLLDNVDTVIYAAGVLQPARDLTARRIHEQAPRTLFHACAILGIRRVILVSAVGIDETQTAYATSKRAGETALQESGLDWTIIRPAIVVGAGSYGGTSLLRAAAAAPWRIPLPGREPIPASFIDTADLADGIVSLIDKPASVHKLLEAASTPAITLDEATAAYRTWLGLPPAPFMRIPHPVIRAIARLGDLLRLHPISSTTFAQLEGRIEVRVQHFQQMTGRQPATLREILLKHPATTQDLWHARLYLARPFVRLTLTTIWLASALIGAAALFMNSLPAPWTHPPGQTMFATACAIDFAIAAALFRNWRPVTLAAHQAGIIAAYTIALAILEPSLLTDPIGPLLKNLAILALVGIYRVLEQER